MDQHRPQGSWNRGRGRFTLNIREGTKPPNRWQTFSAPHSLNYMQHEHLRDTQRPRECFQYQRRNLTHARNTLYHENKGNFSSRISFGSANIPQENEYSFSHSINRNRERYTDPIDHWKSNLHFSEERTYRIGDIQQSNMSPFSNTGVWQRYGHDQRQTPCVPHLNNDLNLSEQGPERNIVSSPEMFNNQDININSQYTDQNAGVSNFTEDIIVSSLNKESEEPGVETDDHNPQNCITERVWPKYSKSQMKIKIISQRLSGQFKLKCFSDILKFIKNDTETILQYTEVPPSETKFVFYITTAGLANAMKVIGLECRSALQELDKALKECRKTNTWKVKYSLSPKTGSRVVVFQKKPIQKKNNATEKYATFSQPAKQILQTKPSVSQISATCAKSNVVLGEPVPQINFSPVSNIIPSRNNETSCIVDIEEDHQSGISLTHPVESHEPCPATISLLSPVSTKNSRRMDKTNLKPINTLIDLTSEDIVIEEIIEAKTRPSIDLNDDVQTIDITEDLELDKTCFNCEDSDNTTENINRVDNSTSDDKKHSIEPQSPETVLPDEGMPSVLPDSLNRSGKLKRRISEPCHGVEDRPSKRRKADKGFSRLFICRSDGGWIDKELSLQIRRRLTMFIGEEMMKPDSGPRLSFFASGLSKGRFLVTAQNTETRNWLLGCDFGMVDGHRLAIRSSGIIRAVIWIPGHPDEIPHDLLKWLQLQNNHKDGLMMESWAVVSQNPGPSRTRLVVSMPKEALKGFSVHGLWLNFEATQVQVKFNKNIKIK